MLATLEYAREYCTCFYVRSINRTIKYSARMLERFFSVDAAYSSVIRNMEGVLRVCRWRESDSRPHPYQGCALPLSYNGLIPIIMTFHPISFNADG